MNSYKYRANVSQTEPPAGGEFANTFAIQSEIRNFRVVKLKNFLSVGKKTV